MRASRCLFNNVYKPFQLPPTIKNLLLREEKPAPQEVSVTGWIKSIRKQKRVAFALLSDGSCDTGLQAVITNAELLEGCV